MNKLLTIQHFNDIINEHLQTWTFSPSMDAYDIWNQIYDEVSHYDLPEIDGTIISTWDAISAYIWMEIAVHCHDKWKHVK